MLLTQLSNAVTEAGNPPAGSPDLSFIPAWLAVGLAIFVAATLMIYALATILARRVGVKPYR